MPVKEISKTEVLLDAFAQSEASMKLEGFDPASNPAYLAAKADILAGKATVDEAVQAMVANLRARHSSAA